jgi:hypothetical protein
MSSKRNSDKQTKPPPTKRISGHIKVETKKKFISETKQRKDRKIVHTQKWVWVH